MIRFIFKQRRTTEYTNVVEACLAIRNIVITAKDKPVLIELKPCKGPYTPYDFVLLVEWLASKGFDLPCPIVPVYRNKFDKERLLILESTARRHNYREDYTQENIRLTRHPHLQLDALL